MRNIVAEMPKKKDTISVQAHLMPKEHEALKKLADAKKWSIKKYLEDLIEHHLKQVKK
jgi:hypothetical protein